MTALNKEGVEASSLVERLNNIWRDDDHERGCRGREYDCSCGFDERSHETAKEAADRIEQLERLVEQAFRDGLAYGSNVQNADADIAWQQSRIRSLQSEGGKP